MRSTEAVFSVALFLAVFCCVYSKESVEAQQKTSSSSEVADSGIHLAKKRSAGAEGPDMVADGLLLEAEPSYLPVEDADLDKRSSLFRFGKRQWRYGKRQWRYGKRQSVPGKRGSLFRFGKRSGGTLFRFGRSGDGADYDKEAVLRELLAGYYAPQAADFEDGMAKRQDGPGFHWGEDN